LPGEHVQYLAGVAVFGNLPDSTTNQAAIPGSYSDTIAVTVSY